MPVHHTFSKEGLVQKQELFGLNYKKTTYFKMANEPSKYFFRDLPVATEHTKRYSVLSVWWSINFI